ncbi:zinc finger, CCHC-type containing protein [Tanacetum coccineum]
MSAPKKSQALTNEVVEWLKARIVRPIRCLTWISNPVLVTKGDRSWRMCIEFLNINQACPKDYYPLSKIDWKIESVMGYEFKCFLDAYNGYHEILLCGDDEDDFADNTLKRKRKEKVMSKKVVETLNEFQHYKMKEDRVECLETKRSYAFYTLTRVGFIAYLRGTTFVGIKRLLDDLRVTAAQFRNPFSSTTMGDENPISTLRDYSKPTHEGYRNTIELPIGNNVDFLKLVDSLDLDGENRERTRLGLFQFSLRGQASNWLERLPAGSITTWEDPTIRFLAQFFPPGRTAKLRNDILMFQQHHGESLSET